MTLPGAGQKGETMGLYALIRKPVCAEDMFGLPVDWRLSPKIVCVGTESECLNVKPVCDQFATVGTRVYTDPGSAGVQYLIGEIVREDVESENFLEVAELFADVNATAQRLFGILSAEQQSAHDGDYEDWMETGYHPTVDVPAGISCAALAESGHLWAQIEGSHTQNEHGIRDAVVKVLYLACEF